MRKLIILAFIVAIPVFAQNPQVWRTISNAPSGSCTANYGYLVVPAGTLYTCQNGTWAQASGGGGSSTTAVTATFNTSAGTCTTTGGTGTNSCTATTGSVAITHNLGVSYVIPVIYSSTEQVAADFVATSANVGTFTFMGDVTGHAVVSTGGTGATGATGAAGPAGPAPSGTGLVIVTSGVASSTTAAPNGTTATTQSPGDNTTKVATDAFVIANAGVGSGATEVAVSFSATPTYTCPSATTVSATHFTVGALTGNITSSTLATCTPGQILAFHIVQDGTGGRTVVWPTNFDVPTIALTASTATDVTYAYDGTNGRLLASNGKATPFLLSLAPCRTAASSTTDYPSNDMAFWCDSTSKAPTFGTNAGGTLYVASLIKASRTANQFLINIDANGTQNTAAVAAGDLPGTVVQTTDTGTVTNTMLAGSIANAKLANSTIPVNGTTCTLGTACYTPILQNSQSTAYTTVLADEGKQVLHPTADNNARTFTIDSNANVAYPVGTVITFINQINTLTIAITADTLQLAGSASTGSRTCAAGCMATAIKVASTLWFISGPGLT